MPAFSSGLLSRLLDLPDPSEEVQRFALSIGIKSKDNHLLAKLAAHPALLPEVDRELSKVSAAPVHAAWLARPGRDEVEVYASLAKEKRTTVLAALAERSDLTEGVYRVMAGRMGVSALPVLLANPAVPTSVRVLAARRLGELSSLQSTPHPSIAPTLSGDPALAAEMLATAASAHLAAVCLKFVPTASRDDVDRALVLLEASLAVDSSHTRSAHPALASLETLLSALACHSVTSRQRARLHACADKLSKTAYWWSASGLAATIDSLESSSGRCPHPIPPRIRRAQREEEAVEAFMEGLQQSLPSLLLLSAAAGSGAVSAECFSRLLDTALSAASLEWTQIRALWGATRDPGKLGVLFVRYPWQDLDSALSVTRDPERGLVEAARAIARSGRSIPAALLSSAYFTPQSLLEMPTRLFTQENLELPVGALADLQDRLADSFQSQDFTHALSVLGEEFSGSLADLIDVAARV